MWIHCRSTDSHLVSPPLRCQALSPALFCRSGWYRTGHWNIALNPEGEAGSWGACKCSSVHVCFYGRRSVHSVTCTRARGLAYAAVFMALQTHSLLPHGICLVGCVCAWLRVCEHYEGLGGGGWGGGGGGRSPLPCAWLCFAISSMRGWYLWKRIWISSQFRARERERERGAGEWGGSQRRFQELLKVVML